MSEQRAAHAVKNRPLGTEDAPSSEGGVLTLCRSLLAHTGGDMRRLRCEPVSNARPVRVDRYAYGFVLHLSDGTQLVIKHESKTGHRRLFAFSVELVHRCKWMTLSDGMLVLADTLVFEVSCSRDYEVGADLLLCIYRGIRS